MIPESVTCFREGYTREVLIKDLIAGVIVGIVALPLGIAFAIASGVNPEQGIFTAVIAGFLISVFSGSRVQIGGPTGAFIIVVFGIVKEFGYNGLAVATVMAGLLLVLMGLTRMGSAIKFIPYPMTIGFTSGIAIIIFTTQIYDFLGLTIKDVPGDFVGRSMAYINNIQSLNLHSLLVGAAALLIIFLWPKITHKIPGSVVAIIITTILVSFFNIPVETIGSRFGSVPSFLPAPTMPHFSFDMIKALAPSAFTIAMLGAIESLLSAVVADGILGTRHKSNTELIAQGIANIVVPFFGGIPATGAIARTATNIKSGGTTPVAGIVHAVTLLLIMFFFGKWATLIPMATLSAILMVVAYHMSGWRFFVKLFKSPRSDVFVLLITFVLTLFVNLTVAIEIGVLLSAVLFMNRMSNETVIRRLTKDSKNDLHALSDREIPESVEVFEIQGPFFFGAANRFKETIGIIKNRPKVLIIRCRDILSIDATAMQALDDIVEQTQRQGTVLLLSGVHTRPFLTLQQTGLSDKIGEENIFGNIDDSLNRAREILGLPLQPKPEPFVPTVSREKEEA